MKWFILLTVLVSACCAADLLGADRCTQGPSYWCSHIRSAKECGAIQHCRDNVWSLKFEKQNDEVCDFCKEVITTVRNLIANNATEQQIIGFLKSACDLIPDEELKTMCNTAVSEYGQELFDLILSELDPEVICTAMGLCQPGIQKKLPDMKPILKKVSNQDMCTDCKNVISEAQQALKDNKTRAEILEVLEELCAQLGPFADECKQFMDQYIPELMDLLASELDPEVICRALGFCPNMMRKKLSLPSIQLTPAKKVKSVDASIECVICEFAMQEIEQLITQNSSASEIISVIDKICTILPDTIRGECKAFIDQYGPAIIQLLVQEISPDKICAMLNLCTTTTLKADTECDLCKLVIQYADSVLLKNSSQQEIIQGLHDFCNILPADLKDQCNSLISQYGIAIPELLEQLLDPLKICELFGLCGTASNEVLPVVEKKKTIEASMECVVCEYIMQELDQILGQNATAAEIMTGLLQVCSLLPSSVKAECTSFVDEYGPAVIQLLINELDPQKVCSALGLCSSMKIKAAPLKDTQCDICKLVVQYVDSLLSQNATQQEIEQGLEQLCGILPGDLAQQCDSLVEQYLPVIFQLIQTVSADQICGFIGLCTSSEKKAVPPKSAPAKDDAGCDVCKLVVQYLDSMLEKNATQQEIEQALEQICGILPGDLKQECDSLVQQYGPILFQLLQQLLTPDQVCDLLGLCTGNGKQTIIKPHVNDDAECSLCKLLVQYLDSALGKNATQQEIEQALEQVCNILPGDLPQECNALVEQYGPILFQLLQQFLTPDQVCDFIGLCTGSPLKYKPLNKCMYGPSYWCANESNAKMCNAVEHCKLHVW